MECAAINVVGGTGAKTPATVSFPGAYAGAPRLKPSTHCPVLKKILHAGTDPGIKINIYQTLTSYTVPGPAVFTC